jgi:arylformamidase
MNGRIVDLTVPVGADTRSPPSTDMRVELQRHRRGPGFWQVTSIHQSLHTGTHVDSGLHCYEDGGTTDGITLDQVCGDAVIFDLGELPPSTEITPEMLERADPGLGGGQIAIVRTAWTDRAWGDFPRFFVESPYLAVEAAEWLAARGPKAVCFDFFEEYSARLPSFRSEDFQVHMAFLGKGIVIIEQATGLGELVGKRGLLHLSWRTGIELI